MSKRVAVWRGAMSFSSWLEWCGPVTGQSDAASVGAAGNQATSQEFTELRAAVANVAQLGADVRSGRVVLDPATGAKLLATLQQHSVDVGDWSASTQTISRSLPMGNNPVGAAMSAKFTGRVEGHPQALVTVISMYHDAVNSACQAISQAMAQYADNEDSISSAMRRTETA